MTDEDEPNGYQIQVSPQAEQDMKEMYDYRLRSYGEPQALKHQGQILRTMETIETQPHAGSMAKNRNRSAGEAVLERFCVKAKATIAYTIDGYLISVLTVRDDVRKEHWY